MKRKRKCVLTVVSVKWKKLPRALRVSAGVWNCVWVCVSGCSAFTERMKSVAERRNWLIMTKLCAILLACCSGKDQDLLWGAKVLGDVAYLKLPRKYLKIFFFFFFEKRVYWISCNIASVFTFLVFWPWGMRDFSFPTRDQTCTLCIERWICNRWTARQVPKISKILIDSKCKMSWCIAGQGVGSKDQRGYLTLSRLHSSDSNLS